MPYPFVPGEILTSANLNAALDMRMPASGTGMGLIPGGVAFGHATNGGFQTDYQNLFYDDVNDRLGVGTNIPQALLHVGKTAASVRSYNSWFDAANNAWAYLGDWTRTAGVATYGTNAIGAGVVADVALVRGGVEYLRLATGGLTASVGVSFGAVLGASTTDLSKHITLHTAGYGFGITSGSLNYVVGVGGGHGFYVGAINPVRVAGTGLILNGSTSGSVTLAVPAAAGANTITFPAGTTNFSTTGGAGRIVKQLTAGGAFTVATLNPAEIVGLDPIAITPVLLGTAPIAAAVRGVCVMGNYAYTLNQSATALVDVLEIFDITVSTAPVKVGGLILPNQGLCPPVVAGDILYSGCNSATAGLQIIDVSNPIAPSVLRSFNAGAAVQALALSGPYLYVGYGGANATFRIYDISDPANILTKSTVTMPGASGSRTIVLQGKYAFVGTGQAVAGVGGLLIYDVSNVANPVLVSSSFNCAASVAGLYAADKYLYVATNLAANGIEVVDINDPVNPTSIKIFAITGVTNVGSNPILAGNNLYIITNSTTAGLQVVNVSDPANPSLSGTVTTVASAFGLALRGDCLYVTANAQLRIYDTGGLDSPTVRTGSINTDNIYVDGQSNFNGDIYAQRGVIVGQAGILSRGAVSTPAISTNTIAGAAGDYTQAQWTMSGGGTISWGGLGQRFKWTQRFVVIPAGRTGMTSGYIQMDQPIVDIPAAQVYNGIARTADINGVVLNAWEALYAAHTIGGIYTAVTYYIVVYTVAFVAPSNWILIAAVNGDSGTIKLGTGNLLYSGQTVTPSVDTYVRLSPAVPQAGGIGVLGSTTTVRNYNIYTDALNNEWSYLGEFNANIARYGTDLIGSGVIRDVQIYRGGVPKLYFESAGVRVGDATRLSVGNPGAATNMATLFAVRDSTAVGATAGLYNYPFELHGFAGANVIRLQTAIYRRYAGASWQGSGFRLQYAVDNSFTDGSRAFMEIGAEIASGAGQIIFGTQGGDRFSILGSGNVATTGALQVLGNTGATDGASLNVDAVAAGATAAKFGLTQPMYLLAGPPTIGFNVYWNAAWLFGKGSVAGTNYAGYIRYDTTTGATSFSSTTATGAANAAASLQNTFQISNQGIVVLGPGAAFSNAFPALRRNGASLEAVLGDQSNYAPLIAATPAFGNTVNVITSAYTTAYYMPLGGGSFTGGIDFGSVVAASATDLSKHIELFSTTHGFNITSGTLNYVVPVGNSHQFVVNAASVLTMDTLVTVKLAMKLTSASGATDFAPFNVDIVSGATSAKFGSATPIYMVQGPIIGFNAYYDTAWKFGKGSTAHWGGYLTFDSAGSGYALGSSTAAGAANAAATMQSVFRVTTTGDRVTWGPNCAFTSAFPALRRSGAATEIVTADSAAWGVLNVGPIGVQTGGITIASGSLTVTTGNVQLNNGYISAIASPPSLVAQGVYAYIFMNTGASAIVGNAYLDATATWKYRTATAATVLNNDVGGYAFYTAPVGTVGATVTTWTNRFNIANNGIISVNGIQMLFTDATTTGFNKVYSGDGTNVALYLGGTSDRQNYYRNTTHQFQSRDIDGATGYATIAAGGTTIFGTWLYLAGGSGGINVTSGPGVYGDANWLITKPGANNLGWMFQTYAGTNRYIFNADGQMTCNMPSGGLWVLNSVTGADCAIELKAGTSFDWKLYGSTLAGNFMIINSKTGAQPFYITQANQTVIQGQCSSSDVIYTGNAALSLAGGVALVPGGASQGGFTAYYNSAGTRLFYVGFHNSIPGLTLDVGGGSGEFQVRNGHLVTTNGAIQSRGTNSILSFDNRSNTAVSFGWYSASSKAICWYSGTGDKFWFDATTDTLSTIGAFTAASISVSGLLHSNTTVNASNYNLRSAAFALMDASATYTQIFDPGGSNILMYYSTGQNFYDNNQHWFRSRAGASNMVEFTGAQCLNTNGVWVAFSDASLKEEVKPWTHRGLEAISKLVPVSFKYKRGTPFANAPNDEQDTILGLIAQEAKEIVPELVGEQEGYVDGVKKMLLTTRPGQLVYVLVNAVKELKERVEMLEAKLGEA